jgi:2',3'-cyclic-nucleotide 2'-phosphodiesterase (5'-nucleotidase family)
VSVLAWLVLLALPGQPGAKSLTIAFQGDNGGEIAPCGCQVNPSGGLPKRKTVLEQLASPHLLVLDSGNALFANAGVASAEELKRATFIFNVMDELGTRAMAVGQRDLSGGTAFLESLTKGHALRVLSANLMRDGRRVFDASTVFQIGGVSVALIGVTAPGPVVPNDSSVMATPTVAATRAALKQLGKREVTVVLAATSYADAMQLSQELGSDVDFIVQSGEFRGAQPPQRVSSGSSLLLASAQKGQALANLELTVGSKSGPFIDVAVAERHEQQLTLIDSQMKSLETRLKMAKDSAGRQDIQETMGQLQQRKRELGKPMALAQAKTARLAKLEWLALGAHIVDDAGLKTRVAEFEPRAGTPQSPVH